MTLDNYVVSCIDHFAEDFRLFVTRGLPKKIVGRQVRGDLESVYAFCQTGSLDYREHKRYYTSKLKELFRQGSCSS